MEKQIRIVWALSLVSALVVIGVQGYWLYNQYVYVIDGYMEEMAELVMQAGEQEFELRQTNKQPAKSFVMKKQSVVSQEAGSVNQGVSIAISMKADSINSETAIDSLGEMPEPEMLFKFFFEPSLTDVALHAGINRAMLEMRNPFKQERLDSLLSELLPGVQYASVPWGEGDATYVAHWEKAGGLLRPQLVLASGLILLLIGCLVFQIKTILRQKKLSELRESFVNTMIHELKRPVQTLKTFVAFLGDQEMRSDETVTRQVVQDSMFELDNLSAYLNKLRDMLNSDSETTPLHIVAFDLQELLEKVVRLTPTSAAKEVKLSVVCDLDSPWVEADPVHVANILSNLIENAVKYSGQEVRISLKAVRRNRELCLSVSDNGFGIPLAEQEKVFAKFYRGSNLPDKNIPGLGLGLSYVKLITEAHRGTIRLSSRAGEGTSIQLCFPQ